MTSNLMLGLFAAAGGAIGSATRFAIGMRFPYTADRLPLGTLLVNVTGSILIGLLIPALATRLEARTFLVAGVCGGYTTFSAFSIETVNLLQAGRLGLAFLYMAASLTLCLGGTWLGLTIAR